MRRHSSILFSFAFVLLVNCGWVEGGGVHLSVSGNWQETPIVFELAEGVSQLPSNSFWRFLVGYPTSGEELSGKEKLEQAFDHLENITSQSHHLPLLQYAVASRHYNPTVISHLNLLELDFDAQTEEKKCNRMEAFAVLRWSSAGSLSVNENGESFFSPPQPPEDSTADENKDQTEEGNVEEMNEYTIFSCNGETLKQDIDILVENAHHLVSKSWELYPSLANEHQWGALENRIFVVLYADFTHESFEEFKFLLDYAEDASKFLRVTFRYNQRETQEGSSKVSLQGYGAELVLKNTEYRTVDDSSSSEKEEGEEQQTIIDENEVVQGINFSKLIKKKPELETSLRELRSHLADAGENIRQLKRWEMTDLSLQAAYAATKAENTWEFLTELTGNFPSLATSLATVPLPSSFRKQVEEIKSKYGPDQEFALVNGRQLPLDDVNPFLLYSLIEEEFELYDIFETMDFPVENIKQIMNVNLPDSEKFRLNIQSEHVLWVNNIESDPQYFQWPNTVFELFKPVYPDQLRFIRKNLINSVFFVNSLSEEAFSMYNVIKMYLQGAPVRMGILFDRSGTENPNIGNSRNVLPLKEWDEPLSDVLIGCYYYIHQNQSPMVALDFLANVASDDVNEVSLDSINDFLAEYNLDLPSIFSDTNRQEIDNYLQQSSYFAEEIGIAGESPMFFLNGVPFSKYPLTSAGISGALKSFISEEYSLLQKLVWSRQVTDSDNIYQFILSLPSTNSIYNSVIVNSEEKYVPINCLTMPIANERESYRMASKIQLGFGEFLLNQLDYITSKHKSEDVMDDITHFLVLDLSTQQALRTLVELTNRFDTSVNEEESYEDTKGVRFAVIHNSGCVDSTERKENFEGKGCFLLYSDLLNIAGRTFTPRKYAKFINYVLPNFILDSNEQTKEVDVMAEISEHVRPGTIKRDSFMKLWKNGVWKQKVLSVHSYVLQETFSGAIEPGRNYIITNGRLTKLPVDLAYLPASGFRLLESQERQKTKAIREIVETLDFQHVIDQEPFQSIEKRLVQFRSDLHMKASSILYHRKYELGRQVFAQESNPSKFPISIQVVLDPLSTYTRTLAPILSDLLVTFDGMIDVEVSFNPKTDLSELPLSSYYRYAIKTASIDYDSEGYPRPHSVTFTNLPNQLLLSLTIDSPSSWMVQSLISEHDLDNIILGDISGDFVFAEFVLKSLVIQGSARDVSAPRQPPRGTELILKDYHGNTVHDTIVMANHGYFQLQANPGLWFLEIAPGRSSKVFSLSGETPQVIFMDSFAKTYQLVSLEKNEGMEYKEVLDLPPKKAKHDQTIHVFSLASGHVYERFLKIMILTVIQTTDSPVKFWFVENFLSPQFKNTVEEMSREYSFEVELVSYQWPSWLHEQTEKQREIWAYKILFLDVLFPLNVHRVIFVDADLVVRADLRELNELDLEGAPYGYTPFCDSREEMDGFRFWKTGFWDDHLKSIKAKYHISALYVVDLDNFRNNAIGDILRSVYNSLSKDPNSLANLDQDLPNFTQNNIPIYSLDQSWLWCETWCSDESKEHAKAIDLCNNPLTKTPKLDNAVRIVDEWSKLDQEARSVEVPKEKTRTINPVHELIARNSSVTWSHIASYLQALPVETEETEEKEESNSWFSQIVQDII